MGHLPFFVDKRDLLNSGNTANVTKCINELVLKYRAYEYSTPPLSCSSSI